MDNSIPRRKRRYRSPARPAPALLPMKLATSRKMGESARTTHCFHSTNRRRRISSAQRKNKQDKGAPVEDGDETRGRECPHKSKNATTYPTTTCQAKVQSSDRTARLL